MIFITLPRNLMKDEQEAVPFSPVNFFQISAQCHHLESQFFPGLSLKNYRKYLLPNTSALCAEERFAEIAMAWHQLGIEFFAEIKEPMARVTHPNVHQGDSVEIFIDTRDVKTSGYNTRFCHHFFFLPEAVEGVIAGEITRFRTEDVHDLCDSNELKVQSVLKNNGYHMHIFIPTQCLYGYDPGQFNRLGFTYRINRSGGSAQHFSVVSEEYQIEQQPSLWSSLILF